VCDWRAPCFECQGAGQKICMGSLSRHSSPVITTSRFACSERKTRMNEGAGKKDPRFTEAGFRALASQRLDHEPTEAIFDPRTGRAWGRGDWDLNPELLADFAVMKPPRPAAVLIGIVARSQLMVLLTQRTHTLSTHAGQIAFPGGKVEPDDGGPIEAALRESFEEIGLDRANIEPLGFIDGYRTGTGFNVSPVVALVRPDFVLRPDPREVDEVFEVPLAFLMNEANHEKHTRDWRGRQRHYYAMPYEGRYIWGATAGMLKNLYQRLFAP
jgi:8-oxo-dGTP pyrophosphatase MutT (NUDIX family)